MANTVQILVAGTDYTKLVDYESISVDNNLIMTSDTMSLTMVKNPSDNLTRPLCGQEIIWQNPNIMVNPYPNSSTSMAYREFGGVITEVHETTEDGVTLYWVISAKSYDHWLNRHLVAAWYSQDYAENIIKTIIGQFAPTFDTSNIQQSGLLVIPQYFDYVTVSDAIKQISDQLEWGFYCDYYKSVHFFGLESFPTPLPNNTLNCETDMQNYGDLELIENGDQMYNKVFIRGFKTRSNNYMQLVFTADGTTTQWDTGYRISSLKGDVLIAIYPSLAAYHNDYSFQNGGNSTLGTVMTLKRDSVDGSPDQKGANNTAYVNYYEHLIRINNFNGGVIPAGYIIAVRCFYLKDTVFLAQDPASQQRTASIEGTDGVYEYSLTDKSLSNSTMGAVESKGQLLLQKYGHAQVTGSFSTYFNGTSTTGWRAGQFFNLTSTYRFGGTISNPYTNTFYIQRVTKSIVKNDAGGLVTHCEIEFADSPYLL